MSSTSLRQFRVDSTGTQLCDTYVTEEGVQFGATMPLSVISTLSWAVPRDIANERQDQVADTGLAKRVARPTQEWELEDITLDNLKLVRRGNSAQVLSDLERILDSSARQEPHDPAQRQRLTYLAGTVLAINAANETAAAVLVEDLHSNSTELGASAAYAIGSIRHVDADTVAMRALVAGVRALLERQAHGWPRFAYACIGTMMWAGQPEVRARCFEELQSANEDDRLWLIAAIARSKHADGVALFRSQFPIERSSRLRLRLMVDLGPILGPTARAQVLGAVLTDESPWWRWQAIQELWRVDAARGGALGAHALEREPDPVLQKLLSTAVQAVGRPGAVARRRLAYSHRRPSR